MRHSSTCGERTTIVPSRVLPEPVKLRSTPLPGADGAGWVDPEPETAVGVLEPWVALAPVLAARAGVVRVAEEAPLFARALPLPPLPAATIAGPLVAVVALAPVLVELEPPPPQPLAPNAARTGKATASTDPRAAMKVGLGEEGALIIENSPAGRSSTDPGRSGELIESTSSSRAPARAASAPAAAAAAPGRCPRAPRRSAPSPGAPRASAPPGSTPARS